jgi:hypothetical protein
MKNNEDNRLMNAYFYNFKKEKIMPSKKINSQVKKAIQLIEKEGWLVDVAVEACYTSVNDDISLEEFTFLVTEELGEAEW